MEAEKLKLYGYNQYHELMGYLYAQSNTFKAIEHYENAVKLTKFKTGKRTLTKEVKRLIGKMQNDAEKNE
ncbi:hypothetical protein [Echinicola shivajiensis]|uniref:hypothetical protein n=1 Tax=Echinicola shivajiensis TaxID=1035916 RepID=UPI001BFCC1DC|nr:hypothetical protein [Echinicola shivajiensis]